MTKDEAGRFCYDVLKRALEHVRNDEDGGAISTLCQMDRLLHDEPVLADSWDQAAKVFEGVEGASHGTRID